MSRKIDTTPDYLVRTSPIVTAYPFTVAGWFLPNTGSNIHRLWGEANTGASADFFLINYHSTNTLLVAAFDVASQENAFTTNAANLNEWNSFVGIFTSPTSRTAILNGDLASKGTNTVSTSPTSLDNTSLGALVRSSVLASAIDFLLANVAVWDVAFTDNEITAHSRGAHPHEIRRGSLKSNYRLLGNTSPEQDSAVPNQSMTLVGSPAKGNHQGTKLWTPPPPTFFEVAAGPSGGAIQKVAFEYRH